MSDNTQIKLPGTEILTKTGPMLVVLGVGILSLGVTTTDEGLRGSVRIFLAVIVTLAGLILTFRTTKAEEHEVLTVASSGGDIEHAVNQLARNYEILRSQTTQGFIMAGMFMTLGLVVLLSGPVGRFFGFNTSDDSIKSIAGVIMEFISGTALLVYRANFNRLNKTSDNLLSTWKIMAAFNLTKELPPEQKAQATMQLITLLAGTPGTALPPAAAVKSLT